MAQRDERREFTGISDELPRWKRATRFLARLFLMALILAGVWYGNEYFRIAEVDIEGGGMIPHSTIAAAAGLEEGNSILFVSEARVAESIKEHYPEVKEVSLNRRLPDRVELVLEVREPAAYVDISGKYLLMDKEAFCYAQADRLLEGYPVIRGLSGQDAVMGQSLGCLTSRNALQEFFAVWPENDLPEVREISLQDSYNLTLYTSSGLEIWMGEAKNMDRKLLLLQEALPYFPEAEEVLLDLRSGNRLVLTSSRGRDEMEVSP